MIILIVDNCDRSYRIRESARGHAKWDDIPRLNSTRRTAICWIDRPPLGGISLTTRAVTICCYDVWAQASNEQTEKRRKTAACYDKINLAAAVSGGNRGDSRALDGMVTLTTVSVGQLDRIVHTISGESSAPAVARATVRELSRLLGSSRTILAFFDADGRTESVTRYIVGLAGDDGPIIQEDERFLQTAYEKSQIVLHQPDDILAFPAVAAPCQRGTRQVGAIGVIFGSVDHAVSSEVAQTLSLIGVTAAIAIENLRLSDAIQESISAEEDLSNQWLGHLESSATDMIFVTDDKGRVIDANQLACRALGYSKHELLLKGIGDLVPSPAGREDKSVLLGLIAQIILGNVTQFDSAFLSKSGRVFPISVQVHPVQWSGGTAVVSVAVDTSERRRAETQLVQSQRLRALGEMAAGVVHDINNMLTAALGPIELILASSTDPTTRSVLPGVQQALLDGAHTVRRIQDFARQTQSGRTEFVRTDLTALANDVVDFIRPRWQTQSRQQGITLDVTVRGKPGLDVLGNPVELREMILNIVNNAIDAMPNGGKVELITEQRGSNAVLRIVDTGSGMPPEIVQRIFDPFFTTKGPRGSGLGLSVVYGIVGRHLGEIAVDSIAGSGTTFTVTIPTLDRDTVPTPASPTTTEASKFVETESRPLTVMVIDDQPTVAAVLRLILEIDGNRAIVYENGPDALVALHEYPWDLVCTDIDMPDMNGWEVARRVNQALPGVPVVVVTGWSETYDSADLKQRGVHSVLSKPYQIRDIRALLGLIRNKRPN
jgi:PAS domain S-box-containing protein